MTPAVIARPTSRLSVTAGVWSLLCAALGLWWLLDPAAYVLDDHAGHPTSLMTVLPRGAGALLFFVLGLAGAAVAVHLPRTCSGTARRRALMTAGAALAVFFGVAVPDLQMLSVLGYALALLGGPILAGILVAGVRRHPRNLFVLLLMAAAIGVGAAAGEIGEPTMQMLANVRNGMARVGPRPLVLAFMLAGGLLFAATTVQAVHRPAGPGPDGGRGSDWVRSQQRLQRWGQRATILAALCPLPYGLIRMTWLTPWPQGLGPGNEAILDGGIRVFGVCLGLAALGGAWLTLGLISRWGEVWPGWLPSLRGRPVPVLAAVVPAAVVALALCASSASMIVLSVADGAPWLALIIPTPVWGPALALATYSYYRRRTDQPWPTPGGHHVTQPRTGVLG